MFPVGCLAIPPPLHVATFLLEDGGLTILAAFEAARPRCPLCGQPADRVHSRYTRTLADLPWAGLAARFRVHVRKFFCDHPACPRRVFAERLDGVAEAHARRTDRRRDALTAIAFAVGGEAGARLAGSDCPSAPAPCCASSGVASRPTRPRRRCSGSTTGPSTRG